jgi:hypothetical protein
VRAQGIYFVRDSFHLDPDALFNKHVKWSDAGDKYVLEVTRQAVREDIECSRGQPYNESIDKYRSNIRYRIPAQLAKLDFDRAQIIKDNFPNRTLNVIQPPINVPHTLSWPRTPTL